MTAGFPRELARPAWCDTLGLDPPATRDEITVWKGALPKTAPLVRPHRQSLQAGICECLGGDDVAVRRGEPANRGIKRLEDYLRGGFVRDALDVVLRKSDGKGLPFVRKHLADSSLAYPEHELQR